MEGMTRVAAALGAFTALAVIAYWALVFAGLFPVTELVPGYRDWFLSFPLADAWIAASGMWLAVAAWRRRPSATAAAAALGSALIFLGLYALLYGATTGLLFHLTADELIEIAVKAYCLTVGAFLVWSSVRGSGKAVHASPSAVDTMQAPRQG